ncbi:uncharacterized protein LOC134563224 [Prinia subflava]|uniref:uncharacterized protein LOC134563224 n=1 Tax=Prinia subflava TaxID=208062 RepID=UPI002FDF5F28
MKRLYHFLQRKCSRRNRGYSRDISLSHGGFCSGSLSTHHGRASFTCGRDCSVTYTRRPSACPPLPPPAPYSVSAGFSCDTHGSLEVTSGDCGVTSGWDPTVGTVPVYGPGTRYEDVGPVLTSGGSTYHAGDLGMAEGAGYGYTMPLRDTLTAGRVTEGPGYYGEGLGYGAGAFPGPELGPAGGGCAQVVQQKCPVVVPPIKSQQCKQSPQWPPVQKK